MDTVNHPEVDTVVIMSSSQVGKTETCLNIIGYFIHQDPCPILFMEPTLEIAEAYSKDRLIPMIRDTPILSEIFPVARSKDGTQTLLHKKFPGGHVTLIGSNSAAGVSSRPIRVFIADEVDRYPPSAGTEGNPLSLGDKRTTTFWNRKKIRVSSPTVKGASEIEREFEASDKRYYHVPCPQCGKFQKLEWEYVRWEQDRPETAVYICCHCGAAWNDAMRWEAVMQGRWIAEAPFKGIAGFHIWEAYSPWSKLSEMANAFLKAKHAADQGDNEPLKAFVNTVLGKTWEERGEAPTQEPLLARRENYSADSLPYRILYLTAGVDVQDNRLEIEIVGWRAEKRGDPIESWGLDDFALYGDPSKGEVWEELDQVLLREYMSEDGRRLRIAATAIDSGGHHTDAVYRFCNKRYGRHVYAIKGADGARPIWPRRAGKSKKYASLVWLVGVDTAKDAIYSSLRVTEPGPGYAHFPIAYRQEYFKQLTSEQIRTRYVKGHPVRYWFLPAGQRNEALDRRVYALAAIHARPVPWEILARSAPTEPPERPEDEPASPKSTPSQSPKASERTDSRKVRLKFR